MFEQLLEDLRAAKKFIFIEFYIIDEGLMWNSICLLYTSNETLFEILLTIDGKEEFGKNYVLLIPANAEEDENGEVEIQAYSFTENEDGTEGDLQPIPEDSDAEWDICLLYTSRCV